MNQLLRSLVSTEIETFLFQSVIIFDGFWRACWCGNSMIDWCQLHGFTNAVFGYTTWLSQTQNPLVVAYSVHGIFWPYFRDNKELATGWLFYSNDSRCCSVSWYIEQESYSLQWLLVPKTYVIINNSNAWWNSVHMQLVFCVKSHNWLMTSTGMIYGCLLAP